MNSLGFHLSVDTHCSQYIIINLGMSKNFGNIDFDHLVFPNHMRVDYIRVYQDMQNINVGCNPPGFPTEDYIDQLVRELFLLGRSDIIIYREDTLKLIPIQT